MQRALLHSYTNCKCSFYTESVEESNAEARLNVLVNTLGHLFQSFYQLITLAATYTHSSLPRPRPHNVLYPEFVCSDFHGRDVFSDLERCEPLFWNLTGESLESFRRILDLQLQPRDKSAMLVVWHKRISYQCYCGHQPQ